MVKIKEVKFKEKDSFFKGWGRSEPIIINNRVSFFYRINKTKHSISFMIKEGHTKITELDLIKNEFKTIPGTELICQQHFDNFVGHFYDI
jgi:hypothetical protein